MQAWKSLAVGAGEMARCLRALATFKGPGLSCQHSHWRAHMDVPVPGCPDIVSWPLRSLADLWFMYVHSRHTHTHKINKQTFKIPECKQSEIYHTNFMALQQSNWEERSGRLTSPLALRDATSDLQMLGGQLRTTACGMTAEAAPGLVKCQ